MNMTFKTYTVNLIRQKTKTLSINPFLHEYVLNFTHYEYISILALVLTKSFLTTDKSEELYFYHNCISKKRKRSIPFVKVLK